MCAPPVERTGEGQMVVPFITGEQTPLATHSSGRDCGSGWWSGRIGVTGTAPHLQNKPPSGLSSEIEGFVNCILHPVPHYVVTLM